MKKLFIAMMAMAAFAACSNEEPVASLQGDAIAFGDAFVDNATKAIIENSNDLTGFTVFGNVKGTGAVVALYGNGAAVTRDGAALGTAWSCDVVRYWTPSCQYKFAAVDGHSGVTLVDGVPTEISYTVDTATTKDLIYGAATATTDTSSVPSGDVVPVNGEGLTPNVVAFTMNHLLSRVKVSFQNALATEATDYRYVISGVKAVAAGSGVYAVAGEGTWTPGADADIVYQADAVTLTANTTTDYAAQLLIPTSPVDLVFTYALEFQESAGIWKAINSGTITKTGVIANPAKSCSYHITVKLLAGAQIDFTVDTLTGWGDYSSTIQ